MGSKVSWQELMGVVSESNDEQTKPVFCKNKGVLLQKPTNLEVSDSSEVADSGCSDVNPLESDVVHDQPAGSCSALETETSSNCGLSLLKTNTNVKHQLTPKRKRALIKRKLIDRPSVGSSTPKSDHIGKKLKNIVVSKNSDASFSLSKAIDESASIKCGVPSPCHPNVSKVTFNVFCDKSSSESSVSKRKLLYSCNTVTAETNECPHQASINEFYKSVLLMEEADKIFTKESKTPEFKNLPGQFICVSQLEKDCSIKQSTLEGSVIMEDKCISSPELASPFKQGNQVDDSFCNFPFTEVENNYHLNGHMYSDAKCLNSNVKKVLQPPLSPSNKNILLKSTGRNLEKPDNTMYDRSVLSSDEYVTAGPSGLQLKNSKNKSTFGSANVCLNFEDNASDTNAFDEILTEEDMFENSSPQKNLSPCKSESPTSVLPSQEGDYSPTENISLNFLYNVAGNQSLPEAHTNLSPENLFSKESINAGKGNQKSSDLDKSLSLSRSYVMKKIKQNLRMILTPNSEKYTKTSDCLKNNSVSRKIDMEQQKLKDAGNSSFDNMDGTLDSAIELNKDIYLSDSISFCSTVTEDKQEENKQNIESLLMDVVDQRDPNLPIQNYLSEDFSSTETTLVHFSTARGSVVKASQASLNRAKEMMGELEMNEDSKPILQYSKYFGEVPGTSEIVISKENIMKAKALLSDAIDSTSPTPSNCIKTEFTKSDKKLESRVKKVSKLKTQDISTDTKKKYAYFPEKSILYNQNVNTLTKLSEESPNKNNSKVLNAGFSTASGSHLSTSNYNMNKALLLFKDELNEFYNSKSNNMYTSKQSTENYSFTKKTVKEVFQNVSMKKKTSEATTNKSVHDATILPKDNTVNTKQPSFEFLTAGGGRVSISEKHLQKARSQLKDEEGMEESYNFSSIGDDAVLMVQEANNKPKFDKSCTLSSSSTPQKSITVEILEGKKPYGQNDPNQILSQNSSLFESLNITQCESVQLSDLKLRQLSNTSSLCNWVNTGKHEDCTDLHSSKTVNRGNVITANNSDHNSKLNLGVQSEFSDNIDNECGGQNNVNNCSVHSIENKNTDSDSPEGNLLVMDKRFNNEPECNKTAASSSMNKTPSLSLSSARYARTSECSLKSDGPARSTNKNSAKNKTIDFIAREQSPVEGLKNSIQINLKCQTPEDPTENTYIPNSSDDNLAHVNENCDSSEENISIESCRKITEFRKHNGVSNLSSSSTPKVCSDCPNVGTLPIQKDSLIKPVSNITNNETVVISDESIKQLLEESLGKYDPDNPLMVAKFSEIMAQIKNVIFHTTNCTNNSVEYKKYSKDATHLVNETDEDFKKNTENKDEPKASKSHQFIDMKELNENIHKSSCTNFPFPSQTPGQSNMCTETTMNKMEHNSSPSVPTDLSSTSPSKDSVLDESLSSANIPFNADLENNDLCKAYCCSFKSYEFQENNMVSNKNVSNVDILKDSQLVNSNRVNECNCNNKNTKTPNKRHPGQVLSIPHDRKINKLLGNIKEKKLLINDNEHSTGQDIHKALLTFDNPAETPAQEIVNSRYFEYEFEFHDSILLEDVARKICEEKTGKHITANPQMARAYLGILSQLRKLFPDHPKSKAIVKTPNNEGINLLSKSERKILTEHKVQGISNNSTSFSSSLNTEGSKIGAPNNLVLAKPEKPLENEPAVFQLSSSNAACQSYKPSPISFSSVLNNKVNICNNALKNVAEKLSDEFDSQDSAQVYSYQIGEPDTIHNNSGSQFPVPNHTKVSTSEIKTQSKDDIKGVSNKALPKNKLSQSYDQDISEEATYESLKMPKQKFKSKCSSCNDKHSSKTISKLENKLSKNDIKVTESPTSVRKSKTIFTNNFHKHSFPQTDDIKERVKKALKSQIGKCDMNDPLIVRAIKQITADVESIVQRSSPLMQKNVVEESLIGGKKQDKVKAHTGKKMKAPGKSAFSFSTARGGKVGCSEESSKRAQAFLKKDYGYESLPNELPEESLPIEAKSCFSFSTAMGSKISVSEESLRKAKLVLNKENVTKDKSNVSNRLVKPDSAYNKLHVAPVAEAKKPLKETIQSNIKQTEVSNSHQSNKMKPDLFLQTGKFLINSSACGNAFQETVGKVLQSQNDMNSVATVLNHGIEHQTLGKKSIDFQAKRPLFEKHNAEDSVNRGKNQECQDKQEGPSTKIIENPGKLVFSFSTASGGKIGILEESLKKAQELFKAESGSDFNDSLQATPMLQPENHCTLSAPRDRKAHFSGEALKYMMDPLNNDIKNDIFPSQKKDLKQDDASYFTETQISSNCNEGKSASILCDPKDQNSWIDISQNIKKENDYIASNKISLNCIKSENKIIEDKPTVCESHEAKNDTIEIAVKEVLKEMKCKYDPNKPEALATIGEIISQVKAILHESHCCKLKKCDTTEKLPDMKQFEGMLDIDSVAKNKNMEKLSHMKTGNLFPCLKENIEDFSGDIQPEGRDEMSLLQRKNSASTSSDNAASMFLNNNTDLIIFSQSLGTPLLNAELNRIESSLPSNVNVNISNNLSLGSKIDQEESKENTFSNSLSADMLIMNEVADSATALMEDSEDFPSMPLTTSPSNFFNRKQLEPVSSVPSGLIHDGDIFSEVKQNSICAKRKSCAESLLQPVNKRVKILPNKIEDIPNIDKIIASRKIRREEQKQKINNKRFNSPPISPGLYMCIRSQQALTTFMDDPLNNPQTFTHQELLDIGLYEDVINISSKNACDFKFSAFHYFTYDECFSYDGYIDLGDGFNIILSDDNKIGLVEIANAFLCHPNVDPTLVPRDWIKNHFRWIVWKLSSLEKSFPKIFANRFLIPVNVLHQLKFRYDREIDRTQRPALRRILECDMPASRRFIACVADLRFCNTDENESSVELELTDGWYSVWCCVDKAMEELVKQHKVKIGTKLIIQGAELVNCSDGCDPLELNDTAHLKLHTNSVRRVRWLAKMGFTQNPGPFTVSLDSILPNGGFVGRTTAVIARVYPILYMSRNEDGKPVLRNAQAENQVAIGIEKERIFKSEELFDEIASEIRKKYTKAPFKVDLKNIPNITDPEILCNLSYDYSEIQSLFTSEQHASMEAYNNEIIMKMRSDFDSILNEKLEKLFPARKVINLLKVRLVDPITECTAILTVWRPSDEVLSLLREGNCLDFYGLTACGIRDKVLQLANTSRTRYNESVCFTQTKKYQRQVTDISDLVLHNTFPMFGELDVVGIVIYVKEPDKPWGVTNVYLSDTKDNFMVITFWTTLRAFGCEDLLEEGSIIAAVNLQRRPGSGSYTVPSTFANELTYLASNPSQEYLQKEIQSLKTRLAGLKMHTFLESRKFLLQTLLKDRNYTPTLFLPKENTYHSKKIGLLAECGPSSPLSRASLHSSPDIHKQFKSPKIVKPTNKCDGCSNH